MSIGDEVNKTLQSERPKCWYLAYDITLLPVCLYVYLP
jgi:hypothetical protein